MSERVQIPVKAAAVPVRPLSPASSGVLQRKCACGASGASGGDCPECKKKRTLQRRAAGDAQPGSAPPIVHEVLRSPGRPLDAATRAFFEPRFGHDFGRVRIHNDARSAASALAVNALAYTVESDIVFGPGRYLPATAAGQHLLAHELAHVVQSGAGSGARGELTVSSPSDRLEMEADRAATAIEASKPRPVATASVPRSGTAALHRQVGPASPPGSNNQQQTGCGPGTSNPLCLPLPGENEPCKPFSSPDHALNVWADMQGRVPLGAATATVCPAIKPVWERYFAATGAPFPPFTDPASCVVKAAKTDSEASQTAARATTGLFKDIVDNLPVTLRKVTNTMLLPFDLRMPLEDAIEPRAKIDLHPLIIYNDPLNAAANIAGAVGPNEPGESRLMGGTVVVQVKAANSGTMSGEIRWQPHVHVNDVVRFCPSGNLGNSWQTQFTLPMSKLEAMGLTKQVPIEIDYDLDLQQTSFSNVAVATGQPAPSPAPTAPAPRAS